MPTHLTLPAIVAKWRGSKLSERSAAQSHFIDLCAVLGEPAPTDVDQEGSFYTFEKGVTKTSGGHGWADVWKRGYFAWEYKKTRRDLAAAYHQLLTYREDLENPPLLVVCDLDRFEVHTNFTGTIKRVYAFNLNDLASPSPLASTGLSALDVIRALFTDPYRLRPQQTTAEVTEAAAADFARLAESLRKNGVHPEQAAHFLMRLLFCMFAEDIGLLPGRLFSRLVDATRNAPSEFSTRVRSLFGQMAIGGWFGVDTIPHFDGGLFSDDTAFDLSASDLDVLSRAARLDWSCVEPAIFGTLFERSLDPDKRSQLGAHYTSKDDILLVVEPVLMEPLRREWAEVKREAAGIVANRDAAKPEYGVYNPRKQAAYNRLQQALDKLLRGFAGRLRAVRALDPACGSGNFLYVALKLLLDLEKEIMTFAANNRMSGFFPEVSPSQLYGIEINPYAHELAQAVVWIGYIQWLQDNGFGVPPSPILKPLSNILLTDAILGRHENGGDTETDWPAADVIVGNPPFLGGKRLRAGLGDEYVERLFTLYGGRVPHEADLACYWFERARALIQAGQAKRAGLLATNSIRGGANRRVLTRIKETGGIFLAWSDRPWILDGAAVRVSMVGFDDGTDSAAVLDGKPVTAINADLTATMDLTKATRLPENFNLAFMGDTKGGSFDVPPDIAVQLIAAPPNPNGRYNTDVVRPWVNGLDVTRRPRGMWIIDFGVDMSEHDAALYDQPFEYVRQNVRPARMKNNRETYRERWWLHAEPRPAMRSALVPLRRFIATPTVAKHRLFAWTEPPTLPDHQLIIIARADDYFFGVLHSRPHELWALRMCSWLGVGNDPRYTPTSTFESFPFPWPPGQEPTGDPRVDAIGQAARDLVALRDNWLNPPGASEAELKIRTLTNLYNQRPTWLDNAHQKLDRAVLDAYGSPQDVSDEQILERLLALNHERASTSGAPQSRPGDSEDMLFDQKK